MKQIELFRIKSLADNLIHCGDYGVVYIKKDLTEVFVMLGDADETDLDELEQYLKTLNVKLTIGGEYGPKVLDYIVLSKGIMQEWWYDEDEDEDLIPIPLSIEEYVDYYRLLRDLE